MRRNRVASAAWGSHAAPFGDVAPPMQSPAVAPSSMAAADPPSDAALRSPPLAGRGGLPARAQALPHAGASIACQTPRPAAHHSTPAARAPPPQPPRSPRVSPLPCPPNDATARHVDRARLSLSTSLSLKARLRPSRVRAAFNAARGSKWRSSACAGRGCLPTRTFSCLRLVRRRRPPIRSESVRRLWLFRGDAHADIGSFEDNLHRHCTADTRGDSPRLRHTPDSLLTR